MKKKIITMLFTATLLASAAATSVFATSTEKNSISGGWSESTGYYINGETETTETYTCGTSAVTNLKVTSGTKGVPSPTPDKHTGKRLKRVINSGGDTESAAFGETLWYYKYHYTTARMELSNGTVKTTSGRQWDDNATKATSPYYLPGLFENTEARTYWGS